MKATTLLTLIALGSTARGLSAQAPATRQVPLAFQAAAAARDLTPRARLLEPMARTENLAVSIGLPLRNPGALEALRRDLQDPASPRYRRWLTPAAFASSFGPTEADYARVMDWAGSKGLAILDTAPNRLVLMVQGTAADLERAFQVRMNLYQLPSGRVFRSPDTAPTLDLEVPIATVNGLDDRVRPVKHLSRRAGAPHEGSGAGGLFLGRDFRAAYAADVPSAIDGAGQDIALLEFSNYYTRDPRTYWREAGLPPPTIKDVAVAGGARDYQGQDEVALDIELAGAMANGATLHVYMGTDGNAILNRIATDNLCKSVGISWSWTTAAITRQTDVDPTQDAILKELDAQGVACFAAAGDSGAWTGDQWAQTIDDPDFNPINPADLPEVTCVGGTELATAFPGGPWSGETPWSNSGGGPSQRYPLPSFQTTGIHWNALSGASTSRRNCPDVAAVASGIYLDSGDGNTGEAVGGTSCAAPLWAAFAALANQTAATRGLASLGSFNPILYRIGTSTTVSSSIHAAVAPDLPALAGTRFHMTTGWGSPVGQTTLDALLGPTLPAVFLALVPEAVALAPGEARLFTATVAGTDDTTVTWSASEGTVTACGLFTAPAKPGSCIVTATSAAEPTESATAMVTVVPAK